LTLRKIHSRTDADECLKKARSIYKLGSFRSRLDCANSFVNVWVMLSVTCLNETYPTAFSSCPNVLILETHTQINMTRF
jgi:hypothetical protein